MHRFVGHFRRLLAVWLILVVPLAPFSTLSAWLLLLTASVHMACSVACVDGTTYETTACAAGVDRVCTGVLAILASG